MASVFIEIDTEQLERDRTALEEGLGQMRQILKNVYEQMEELDGMWDGPANEVFQQQFASDRQEFEAACQEVQGLIDSFAHAKEEYEKCEEQVNAAVAAIRI